MKNSKTTARITVDGRLFQITFWTESFSGMRFPYYSVDEIVTKRRKRFLFGGYIDYEVCVPVCEWWTTESRVESAKDDIRRYLDCEKKENAEAREVINFCKTQVTDVNERTV